MTWLRAANVGEGGKLRPIKARPFACVLVASAAFYVLAYFKCTDRPTGSGFDSGWWTWFDQREYLKSAIALAHGQFAADLHRYPPLYSAMAAPFVTLLPVHPFFPIDIIAFVTFIGVLLWIAGRVYGWGAALLGIVAIMVLAPDVTIRQWLLPWTTTMTGLLISLQLLTAWHLYVKKAPWALDEGRDWFCVAVFFLSFSGLAAARPLDFIAFLPAATIVFVRLQIAAWRANPIDRRMAACVRILVFCVAVCAVCAALLIAFNLRVYGHPTSDYIWKSENGYSAANIPEKIYSIFLNSEAIYSDRSDAIFERLPVFAVVFAIALISLVTARPFIRGIIATGLFQIGLYLPFPDLMPTALYQFNEIHYFKWIMLWFAVIAVGELVDWFRLPLTFPARLGRALSLAAITLVMGRLTLVPVSKAEVAGRRDAAAGKLDIGPISVDDVSYIDIPQLTGSAKSVYFDHSPLLLNGTPLQMVHDYRFISYRDGARLVFIRPQTVRTIHIDFNPEIKLGADSSKLSLVAMRLGFGERDPVTPLRPPLRAGNP